MLKKNKVTLENLAGMVKREFDNLGTKITKFQDENRKDHESFKKDFADIRFRLSELIHKTEFYELQARVEKLETRLGVSK